MEPIFKILDNIDASGDYEVLGNYVEDVTINDFTVYSDEAPQKAGFLTQKTYENWSEAEKIGVGLLVCQASIRDKLYGSIGFKGSSVKAVFWCDQPRLVFAKLASIVKSETRSECIGAHSLVDNSVKLGGGVSIGVNCSIHKGCEIGDNVSIGDNVVINQNVRIGAKSVILDGVVLGSDGFGFERDEKGVAIRIPHFGSVLIGENVEIGANTVVDRGVFGDTEIGSGTKIDNLCHIAHGCKIGENCLITAGSVFCGSIEVGDGVWVAPNSTMHQKITIGEGATIGMGSVVLKSVKNNTTVFGNPARLLPK